MLVRDLAQNLQSPHLLAKKLEIKIKGTVILPVCYGVREHDAGEPVWN